MAVFILLYHIQQSADNEQAAEVAGAYVNCCIVSNSAEKAELVAFEQLSDMKWKILNLEEAYAVTEDDYVEDPDGLEVFKQGLIDGELYSVHTYKTADEEF